MSSNAIIPPEIQEAIIDRLAELDDEDFSFLKTWSLVCKAFLHIARKHIFASIRLNETPECPTSRSFERVLSANPKLADYIRHLHYNITADDLTNPSMQECLKRLTKLQSLSIWHYTGQRKKLDWSNNPLRPVLLRLLHLPSLTYFKVFSIDNLVAADFIPCTNLKKLSIGNHNTSAIENDGVIFSGPLPERQVQLNEWISGIKDSTVISSFATAQRPDGRPVFDFSSLARITVQLERLNDVSAVHELFRRCFTLTDVDVTYWQPDWISTNLSDLLRPSIRTLRNLRVCLHVHGVDTDPLAGIPGELENIRAESEKTNVLESLSIHVLVQTDEDCRTGEDWGRLDEVLAKPGWPKLKKVNLTIEIASFERRDTRLEEALRKLPQEQLARLEKNEAVDFKFDIKNDLV